MGELFRRIHYLLNRSKLERALQNDIEFHREMLSGESRKDFGNATLARERSREAWGWGWLDRLMQDLRFGSRLLKKSPGLAFTAITVLALGIGVNVTVFNIIDVFYFKALPVRDPHSLVRFTTSGANIQSTEVAYPAAVFYRDHNQVLSSVIVQRWSNMTLSQESKESVRTGLVSANYFSELGIAPSFGRLFSAADGAAGASQVAVLGHGFWQRHYGADAAVIGRTISLNQHTATIIGVTPYDFMSLNPDEGERTDIWLMVEQEAYFVPQTRVSSSFDTADSRVHMWGRLKPGVSMKSAEQALLPLAQELAREHPDVLQKDEHLRAAPGAHAATLEADDWPLFGMMGTLVLLILATACGNLGNLLLGRAITREREIATRLALGATRGRIVRQLLTESLLLAGAGAAVAVLLSWMVSRSLIAFLGGPLSFSFAPDWRTVLFAVFAGLLACLLAGMPPARQLARQKHQASRARLAFMATQVVASCVLLVVSALLVRATQRALYSDPGFDYKQTITVDPALYAHAFTPAAAREYLEKLEASVAQVPGVESLTLVLNPPMGNRASIHPVREPVKMTVYVNEVTPDFFRTMGIPLLRGRDFTKNDLDTVVVSESCARKMWPGKDPLQQLYDLGKKKLPVIGVVGNARAVGMRNGESSEMYTPIHDEFITEAVLLLRTSRRPEDIAPIVADVARSIDPVLSPQVDLVRRAFNEKVGFSGKIAGIVSAMGTLALLLAIVGLYGVVAYNVSQKTKEIGIRIALGATPSRVIHSMVTRFVVPLGLALSAGLGLAAAISLVLRTELYGLNNFDPLSYLTAAALLTGVGSLAAILPARRALKVDPMEALRCE
jgi:predicted permease